MHHLFLETAAKTGRRNLPTQEDSLYPFGNEKNSHSTPFLKNTAVEEKFHHGEVRENTMDLFPVHHGGVPTPPWCRENSTMVEWRRHHGEISTAPWCFF